MEIRIDSILTGKVARFGPRGEASGFIKSPCAGPVSLTPLGLAGDEQADRVHHGGVDKAMLHYAIDHRAAWIAEQGELADILGAPGAFGENIAAAGWTEKDICIGDKMRIGSALVEVSQGRQPCWKLGRRFGRPDMVARVVATIRCGWYYRVIEPGVLAAGDKISLIDRPHAPWPVTRAFAILIQKASATRAEIAELAAIPALATSWRERCHAMLK
ncbi:MAG: MOSC domain-containing protein [Sphingomonadaceae bacterium]|nr:MOSC domain-containing protein [Sphingomonadaceae bacterium]